MSHRLRPEFFFFEVDGLEPVLTLAGAGANLPAFTGALGATTSVSGKAGAGCSEANKGTGVLSHREIR